MSDPTDTLARPPRGDPDRTPRGSRVSAVAPRSWSSSWWGSSSCSTSLQDRMIFPGAATQGTPAGESSSPTRDRAGQADDAARRDASSPCSARRSRPTASPIPTPSSRPALLYFYGNAMCLAYAEPEFERFRRLGLNVLIPDYLGYGMSGGKPSEIGCRETAEACLESSPVARLRALADHRRRLVAGRRRRHRPGLAPAGRRADRLQHLHQHARHGARRSSRSPCPPGSSPTASTA